MNAIKVTFSIFSKFFNQAVAYIALFFVARLMGPEPLGIVAFGMAYIALFQNFADLGFGDAHIKRVSEGRDLGICHGTLFSVKIVLNIVLVIVVLSTILFSKYVLHHEFISRIHEHVIYVLLGYFVFGNFSIMIGTTFAARKEVVKGNVSYMFGAVGNSAVKIIVAFAGLGAVYLAGANVINVLIIFLFQLYFLRGYPIKKPTKEYFKLYASFAIPIMFINFISNYSENIDKVLIQVFYTAKDVGLYSAGKQVTYFFSFLTSTTSVLLFPTISAFYAKGDVESIRKISAKTERYLSLLLLPIMSFIFIFSYPITILLLGNKFADLTPKIITVLTFAVYFEAITSNYISQITGTNHVRLAVKLTTILLSFNILMHCLFIPQKFLGIHLFGLGAQGASYATLISAILSAFVYRFFAFRITRARTSKSIFLHLFAAVAMALVMYALTRTVTSVHWYHLILFGIPGLASYIITLSLIKELTPADILYFKHNLNPGNILIYAKKEIREGYNNEKSIND